VCFLYYLLNSHTETCIVNKPMEEIFTYLSNIDNFPKWAKEFASEINLEDGKYKAFTSTGDVFIKFETDEKTGVIDILIGEKENDMRVSPLRVVKLSPDSTAILYTIFQFPDVNHQLWDYFRDIIKKEIRNIERIFS